MERYGNGEKSIKMYRKRGLSFYIERKVPPFLSFGTRCGEGVCVEYKMWMNCMKDGTCCGYAVLQCCGNDNEREFYLFDWLTTTRRD
jgi:hypothetical protein